MSASRDLLGTLAAGRGVSSPSPFESAALEQAGDGLLVVEATGPAPATVYANAAFAALSGYAAEETLGRAPFFSFAPAAQGELERLLRAALATGAPQRVIAEAQSKSGASQWLSLVMRALAPPGPAGHVVITIVDASEQHAAQKRLADSEHHFRILLANAQDLVTVFDANARITFIAGDSLAAFGVRPEERLGRNAFEFVHPDDAAMVGQRLAALGATPGARDALEFRIRRPDGTVRWFNSIGVNLLDDPQVRGIVVNSHDVTERRAAQEALELARGHLDIAVHGARIALWENDVASDVNTWLNDEWYHILGVDPALGRRTVDHGPDGVHPDDLERCRQARQAHIDGLSNELQVPFRMRLADGGYKWLLDRGRVTSRAPDGRALKMSGMTLDIDALKRAEGALRDSESRLEVAVWGTEIGLWEGNVATGEGAWLNDWCERWNLDPCEGAGHEQLWTARVHPEDLPAYEAKLATHLAGGTHQFDVEYRIRDRDGAWVWIEERGRVIERDAAGRALRMVGLCLNIDERRRAAAALEHSEQRFDLAVWGTHVGFWEIDLAGDEMHWWNDWCSGVDLDACSGPGHSVRWDSMIHPDDVPYTMSYEAMIEGAADVYDAEYRMRTRCGGWRWIHSRGRVTARDSTGRALKVAGVTIDIDARKRAELALRDSEARLAAAIWGAELGLWDWDLTTGHAEWLTDWCGQFGIDPCGGPGHLEAWRRNIHPDDRAAAQGRFESALRGAHEFYEGEYRVRALCGRWRWILERGRVVTRGPDGRALRMAGICMDIDARKNADATLRTQATILETMREGVAVVARDASIRLTNPAFDRMFAYEPGAVAGMSMASLVGSGGWSGDLLAQIDLPALDEQQRIARHMEFHRRDGSSFAGEAVITSLALGTERLCLFVVQDITERKRLEQEIIEISNREQQRIGSDLHDGLGQELTGVALMLRSLATKLHRSQPQFGPDAEELVGFVNHAIESARTLARGLSPVTLERGGLVSALRTLVNRASETYGVDVRLQSRVEAQLALDVTTAGHLYRIVQEALNNAVRHGHAQRVHVSLTASERGVRLAINDDGCGLPEGAAAASGMGLKIMAYRARMIDGEIRVAKRAEGGTRVLCTCRVPQSAGHSNANPADAKPSKGERQ